MYRMETPETVYLNKYFQESGLMHQGMKINLVRMFMNADINGLWSCHTVGTHMHFSCTHRMDKVSNELANA